MTIDGYWSRWFLVFLFLISIHTNRAAKVTCLQSAGTTSAGATCEGDYCMYAELPGIREPVRGCLRGDLLKSDIKDQCERSVLEKKDVCICSTTGCNVNANGIRREQTKLLKCYDCEKNCTADTTCYGEYCTLIKYPNGRMVRGCSNPSMPLFERKGLGSCVTPSFPSHMEERHWDTTTLRAITCTCNDRPHCNGPVLTRYVQAEKNTKRCPVRAFASTKLGTHPSLNVPDCEGEHCFNILIEMGDVTSNVSGCMSFLRFDPKSKNDKKLPQHEELNDRGCMTVQSESIRAKACFDTEERSPTVGGETSRNEDDEDDDDEKNRASPIEEATPMDDGGASKDRNQDKSSSSSSRNSKPRSPSHPAARHNQTPKGEGDKSESKDIESDPKQANGKQQSNFIRADEDPDSPVMKPESEGNTALVGAFVAIMVLIVIAGVVWKFELHKKIFHARYQTVAG